MKQKGRATKMYPFIISSVDTFMLRGSDGISIDIGDYLELEVTQIRINGWHACTITLCSERVELYVNAKLGEVAKGRLYKWVIAPDGAKPRLVEIKRIRRGKRD